MATFSKSADVMCLLNRRQYVSITGLAAGDIIGIRLYQFNPGGRTGDQNFLYDCLGFNYLPLRTAGSYIFYPQDIIKYWLNNFWYPSPAFWTASLRNHFISGFSNWKVGYLLKSGGTWSVLGDVTVVNANVAKSTNGWGFSWFVDTGQIKNYVYYYKGADDQVGASPLLTPVALSTNFNVNSWETTTGWGSVNTHDDAPCALPDVLVSNTTMTLNYVAAAFSGDYYQFSTKEIPHVDRPFYLFWIDCYGLTKMWVFNILTTKIKRTQKATPFIYPRLTAWGYPRTYSPSFSFDNANETGAYESSDGAFIHGSYLSRHSLFTQAATTPVQAITTFVLDVGSLTEEQVEYIKTMNSSPVFWCINTKDWRVDTPNIWLRQCEIGKMPFNDTNQNVLAENCVSIADILKQEETLEVDMRTSYVDQV